MIQFSLSDGITFNDANCGQKETFLLHLHYKDAACFEEEKYSSELSFPKKNRVHHSSLVHSFYCINMMHIFISK